MYPPMSLVQKSSHSYYYSSTSSYLHTKFTFTCVNFFFFFLILFVTFYDSTWWITRCYTQGVLMRRNRCRRLRRLIWATQGMLLRSRCVAIVNSTSPGAAEEKVADLWIMSSKISLVVSSSCSCNCSKTSSWFVVQMSDDYNLFTYYFLLCLLNSSSMIIAPLLLRALGVLSVVFM